MGEKQDRHSQLSSNASFPRSGKANHWTPFVLSIFFALSVAPTLVSYMPYAFRWDDADYLWRSIKVTQAFWSGNRHELVSGMVSIRPPVMTLLGIPWGPLASWDAAGKCFLTLNTLSAVCAACCLFLLLRIQMRPLYFVMASACVFVSLGPCPPSAFSHFFATGFMADSLFGWNAFAALLLIPYEAKSHGSSTMDDLVRGALWGLIFSLGAITKVSFLYFIVLIIPILLMIRFRQSGPQRTLWSLISLMACSLPVIFYWLRYGLPALRNGWAASFGHDAPLLHISFSEFLSRTVRASPGLLLFGLVVTTGFVYIIARRRGQLWGTSGIPLFITVGFCAIALASSNRQLRFSFVALIALPYLIGLLISDKENLLSRGAAVSAALAVFCFLVAVGIPMLHRANRQCIEKSEVVIAEAVASNAKRVLLATDSSSLNGDLMHVALAVSPSLPPIETSSLAWSAAAGRPIEDDFRKIGESDLVVFQSQEEQGVPVTNQRVADYEQYIRQHFGDAPIKVVNDIRIYRIGYN